MKSFSKLALSSSMVVLLSACVDVSEDSAVIETENGSVVVNTDQNEDATEIVIEVETNEDSATSATDGSESGNTETNSTETTEQSPNDNNTTVEVITPVVPVENEDVVNNDDSSTSEGSYTENYTENQTENTAEASTETGNESSTDAEQAETSTEEANEAVNESANITESTINAAYLAQVETKLTSTPLMQSVKASIETIDNVLVEQISALSASNPANVKRVESFLSSNDWDYIFPERAVEYSYENFLKAVGKFPAFCGDYDDGRDADAICRKSLATMFAHFTQETGGHTEWWDVPQWRQGLVHIREMAWDETMRGGYNGECNPDVWQGQTWPCGTFANGDYKSYFGRGAKQLSYNYNYGPFSEAMFGDVSVLLDSPELVADTWLNLASAVFFYVYPQPPKPSMLHVIDGTWQPNARDISNGLVSGFGVTTQIINGGVECGGSTEIAQSLNRISYYKSFAEYLGVEVPADEVLGCANMKQFDSEGNGALNIYWEQDWGYVADNPEGKSYACQLVGYQTPFSAFKAGDYNECVEHHFDVIAEM